MGDDALIVEPRIAAVGPALGPSITRPRGADFNALK